MASIVSTYTRSLANLQNLEITVDVYDDGTRVPRLGQAHLDALTDAVNIGRIGGEVPIVSTLKGLGVYLTSHIKSGGFAVAAAGSLGVNGNSAVIDLADATIFTVMASANNTGNLLVQVSDDNSGFFTLGTIAFTSGVSFAQTFTFGTRYVRVQSSVAATFAAGIQIFGKA